MPPTDTSSAPPRSDDASERTRIENLHPPDWRNPKPARRYDLIVIGSHGYSGIDRLIGTTAAKVVNHAKQSVLVVRAAERLS